MMITRVIISIKNIKSLSELEISPKEKKIY